MNELRLERMVHGGLTLGRLPGGRVALVRGGIPGELVRTALEEVSGVLRGTVEEILEASPDRVPPPRHPGLDYGHIAYPRQLELKREVVADALRRAMGEAPGQEGGGLEILEARPSPEQWRYRSVVQPAAGSRGLGYREPGSDRIEFLESDPVANPAVSAAWAEITARPLPKGVREVVIRGNDRGESLIALIASSPQRSLLDYAHGLVDSGKGIQGVAYARFDARGRFRGGSERLAGGKRILQRYGNHDISVTATSFAQPNPLAAGNLYLELASVAGAGGTALDLFAGSGVIALHLAAAFERVDAIEIDKSAVARGRSDAKRLGIGNIDFHSTDARKITVPEDVELVAVDPPRSGLGRETREAIDRSRASTLVYVSCDPATWARDVAGFAAAGWRLELARPYDFYPHTHHVEVLSLLRR